MAVALCCGLFFRNPKRYPPLDKRAVIAPADGIVVNIQPVEQDWMEGEEYHRVSIFLSVFDVHVNRFACEGKVETTHYNPGKFLNAFNEKASEENEQQHIIQITSTGERVKTVQIAGLIARRIVCDAKPEMEVVAGQRLGLIRFGSRTDLFIPKKWDIMVRKGQRTRGGETIIALRELS